MKITCVVGDRALPDSRLLAEHGLSFLIEANRRTMLFDTGQTDPVLLHNLSVLGAAPEQIVSLVLSHAHHVHMGGGWASDPTGITFPWCWTLARGWRFAEALTRGC